MDTSLLDEQEAEKLHGELGVELFRQIAEVFQTEAIERLDEIMATNQNRQGEELAKKAHSIRSSAATLGCLPLATRLKEIELLAREASDDQQSSCWVSLDEMAANLPELLNESLSQLKDYSARLD